LRDGTHPLAVGPVNPGLCQDRADQAGSAGGARTGTRPASRYKDNLNGVGRIESQAGSQAPALRPNHRETTKARHVSELL